MPIWSKRFLMVPEDSSAARMPRPGATIASATLLSSARFIGSLHPVLVSIEFWRALPGTCRCFSRSQCETGGGGSFHPQDLHARQGLTLQPFKKCATGSRYVGEPPSHARGVERRHRVAAACYGHKLPSRGQFRRRLRHLDGSGVERFHLERPERAVPNERLH